MGMAYPAQEVIAGSLGYISIACWLCAQLPQVVKNISLQSCEGLSLPFLVNWLFGDLTNLVGCVLTDQLPFQTYLATYFCIIDFTLCIQYFYYRPPPSPSHGHHHHHHHNNHVHYASIPATAVTSPVDEIQGLSLTLSSPPVPSTKPQDGLLSPLALTSNSDASSSTSTVHPPPRHKRKHSQGPYAGHGHAHGNRSQSASQIFGADLGGLGMGMTSPQLPNATDSYQDLYQAALDVARAAERVSSRRSESRRRLLSRQTTSNTMDNVYENESGMMESFHSEMSGKTESTIDDGTEQRKRMSQSTGNLVANSGLVHVGDRGRSMRRQMALTSASNSAAASPLPPPPAELEDADVLEQLRDDVRPGVTRSKSRSLSVVRTTSGKGKGRRTAGVAFMSIGLVLGYGGLGTSGHSASATGTGRGEVIGIAPGSTSAYATTPIRHPQPFAFSTSLSPPSSSIITMEFAHSHEHPEPPPEPYSMKRLVGRTSAWACTTLYLTSRLPQIWKNFMRKSVEGLSIFLFFFAFCGNLTYVASILLNPAGSASPSDAGHYLLEALPYLLGSGGTLLFDMTIMIQSYMYGSSPPVPETPITSSRRKVRRKRTTTEDGYGSKSLLLNGNGSAHGGHGERRPLLARERSTSPETTMRRGPTA